MKSSRITLTPGGLLRPGEPATFTATHPGTLVLRGSEREGGAELARTLLSPGSPWTWTPSACGQFLAEFICDGETLRRPFAVATRDWSVCQVTVGAFTSDDFSDIIHGAGIAADYYVMLDGAPKADPFSAGDPRWRDYERLHGDAIHPHTMARDVGCIVPELAHHDANWDTLPLDGIVARLRALQEWWTGRGYAPLDRLATYTPSNLFTQACRATGIRVMHSLVPEQNWSDGEWAINHWGMPTCPFWIAPDDFRKAGPRDAQGVLGMTMNHYHVLSPHLTHWGDFVLSPSHFTRWLRAADIGGESTRFRHFLAETVQGGTSLNDDPFFFVAGFEFGRTFGTADMTEWNQAGLRRLIALARTERLVFATSTDVRAYHDRHVPVMAERVFRQRDHWMGVTVNGKPGQTGDAVVIERGDYKALVRDGANLPWLYYDYLKPWSFATRDANAPEDFATACATELSVTFPSAARAVIEARTPLTRTTPVAFWDVGVTDDAFARLPLAPLDDGRIVSVLEVPAGWQGRRELSLAARPVATAHQRIGRWEVQSFGTGADRHTYLHLDAPLVRDTALSVSLRKTARVDGTGRQLGEQPAGELFLEFGPMKNWYRFWGCEADDIALPTVDEEALKAAGAWLSPTWADEVRAHTSRLGETARAHEALRGGKLLCEVFCGAGLPVGTRSRAEAHDVSGACAPGVMAREHSDGVIAFGPGRAFWYHPRTLSLRVDGLRTPGDRTPGRWTVLLHSFDPLALDAAYVVSTGETRCGVGRWRLPTIADGAGAFFPFDVTEADLDAEGQLTVSVQTDQKQILRWWSERGFIAAIHALWVTKRT